MEYLINAAIVLAAFAFMEFVAWFTHKYIMHGWLWVWHESHHRKREGAFEKNDLFAFMFAIPSIWLILLGAEGFDWRFWFGIGIALYGLVYFLVHDVYVHRRVKLLPRRSRHRYFELLRVSHHIHHQVHTKEGAESFGFVWVAPKYWSKVKPKSRGKHKSPDKPAKESPSQA